MLAELQRLTNLLLILAHAFPHFTGFLAFIGVGFIDQIAGTCQNTRRRKRLACVVLDQGTMSKLKASFNP